MTGVPSPEPPPLTSKHLFPIPRISVAWPTFEKAANSTATKIVAQTVFVTGASLTGIPVPEKCTPNALHSYSSLHIVQSLSAPAAQEGPATLPNVGKPGL